MGIKTAADLTPEALSAVKGLAATAAAALLVWRDRVAAKCHRALPRAGAALGADCLMAEARIADIKTAAAGSVRELERAVCTTRNLAGLPDRAFNDALAARDQAVADLRYLRFPVSSTISACRAVPTAAIVSAPAASPGAGKGKANAKAKAVAKGCPKCGGPVV